MTTPTPESALLGLSNDFASAVERAGRSVVTVNARNRIPSTGVHWKDGLIVTADHTVERDEDITVTLPDGQTVPVTLVGRDSSTDLAVLKVENATLAAADLGDSATLKVGHLVLAVGRPGDQGLSASMGVLSAVSGEWRTRSGGQVDQFLRPDLTMYPGFSGGPLVDAQGQIVGITTSHLTRNFDLALPVSTINRVVEQLQTKGHIVHGYLGLGFQPIRLPDNLKTSLNIQQDSGLIIFSVEPNGPAAQSGTHIGDILIALDTTPVTDINEIQGLLTGDHVGKPIQAHIIRGGSRTTLTITVGERPQRSN